MSIAPFSLDPQLAADTVTLGRLALCRFLLSRDSRYPWLILVPERENASEIIDLMGADRMLLMEEIAVASHALRRVVQPDKINVASLGNQVRQLHVHVIARFHSDPAWPGPVWGVGTAQPYPPHALGALVDRFSSVLTLAEVT